ncbi:MAG TPA: hypothetical protein VGO21_02165 [Candidatus Paceibacterota bacterium]|jgi:hypothetical protein|nr:hypothetical protein [Candidatus Paceibacterota bacterium]
MERSNLKTKEELRIEKVKLGAKIDKDGYCGCPSCGSYTIIHDGSTLDNGYIMCLECHYSIGGSDPYETIQRWNNIDRGNNKKK